MHRHYLFFFKQARLCIYHRSSNTKEKKNKYVHKINIEYLNMSISFSSDRWESMIPARRRKSERNWYSYMKIGNPMWFVPIKALFLTSASPKMVQNWLSKRTICDNNQKWQMREFHNESLFPSQKHGIYILHVESELIPIYVNGYIIFYIENTCACKQITKWFRNHAPKILLQSIPTCTIANHRFCLTGSGSPHEKWLSSVILSVIISIVNISALYF